MKVLLKLSKLILSLVILNHVGHGGTVTLRSLTERLRFFAIISEEIENATSTETLGRNANLNLTSIRLYLAILKKNMNFECETKLYKTVE